MGWLALAGLLTLVPAAGGVAQPEPPEPPPASSTAEDCPYKSAVGCRITESLPPEPQTTPPSTAGSPTVISPAYVVVPSLIGLTVARSRDELGNNSLRLDTGAPDAYIVTAQDPPAGAEVAPDSAVFVEARPPTATDPTPPPNLRQAPPPPPGQVPGDPGSGGGAPWTTVAYAGGGGALLALLALLLVALVRRRAPVRRWTRRPAAAGEARCVTGYPPPRVAVRDLPGRPSITVSLRLAADPDRRRPP
jgi:hypothetical protein